MVTNIGFGDFFSHLECLGDLSLDAFWHHFCASVLSSRGLISRFVQKSSTLLFVTITALVREQFWFSTKGKQQVDNSFVVRVASFPPDLCGPGRILTDFF